MNFKKVRHLDFSTSKTPSNEDNSIKKREIAPNFNDQPRKHEIVLLI